MPNEVSRSRTSDARLLGIWIISGVLGVGGLVTGLCLSTNAVRGSWGIAVAGTVLILGAVINVSRLRARRREGS